MCIKNGPPPKGHPANLTELWSQHGECFRHFVVHSLTNRGCSEGQTQFEEVLYNWCISKVLGEDSSTGLCSLCSSLFCAGEASTLRDYAANTMNEFLGMFGYDDQQVRDELAKKISFEKLKAATSGSDPSSLSSEEATRRARFSKYEEYIRKLKAGETLPWPIHTNPKQEDLNSKLQGQGQGHNLGHNPPPTNPTSHLQNMASRASKYDFFIQKLKMGESLRSQQNGNAYKKPSKYDLENVRYLHLFKPGDGNTDMGGAIAYKTGKVGRPSKYDIKNIQKLMPGRPESSLMPSVLPATPGNPGTPVAATSASSTGHLGFNTSDYMKSSFSKTDSITTGTVSSVK
uniref:Castor zinc finger 1 n=1 Tax=Oncorhynchus mykiss TaxID=8022 RepID=A0A8K9WN93_ONCMY